MPVFHLDADAFFASVEQRDDPALRGRPVAVGAGVVASCSYEARRFGVSTGMRLTEARNRCRELIVLPGSYPRYEQAARRMQAICQEQTPLVEVAALDDLYLDVAVDDRPERLAVRVREQVRDEVRLSVSIGVGCNKLVARVATKEAKQIKLQTATGQSAIVAVPPGEEQQYLAPWPLRLLPAAGPQAAERLARLNLHRIGELAAVPVPVLGGLFGSRGKLLSEQAHGIDPRPVRPRPAPQSISRCTSLDPPSADRAFLRAMLGYLAERAASWLRFRDLASKGLTVSIRYGDYESAVGREKLARPTADEAAFREAAWDRFERLYQRRLPLRLVGVELSPLCPPDHQPGLFADEAAERSRRLSACKDAIRQQFGFTSLLSGSALFLAGQLERDRENFKLRTGCLTR